MQFLRGSTGQLLTIDSALKLGGGGEGQVYKVPQNNGLAAKIYTKPTDAHARKLAVMLSNPPHDPMATHGHASIAWPVDTLRTTDSSRRVVGYLMPRLTSSRKVFEFYNPQVRKQKCPYFNYFYLHRGARNLAAATSAIHARGYVIGDVNESNIFVTETALVALIDTDSFQVYDPSTNDVHRCTVHKEEFTPPELQGADLHKINRCVEHDLFGLAVIVFQLLMEGTHPFAGGGYQCTGNPPTFGVRIASGHFPYGKNHGPNRPMPNAPQFDTLHPELQRLFISCFQDGHVQPKTRPNAQTWQDALEIAENDLVTCKVNDQHRFSSHNSRCPWCDRAIKLGGFDCFPTQKQNQRKQNSSANSQNPLPPAHAYPSLVTPKLSANPSSLMQTHLAPVPKYLQRIRMSVVTIANRWVVAMLFFTLAAYWSFFSRPLACIAAIACGFVHLRYTRTVAQKWTTFAVMSASCIMLLPSILAPLSSRPVNLSPSDKRDGTVEANNSAATVKVDGAKQEMYAAIISTQNAKRLNNKVSAMLFTLQDQKQRGALTEENAATAKAEMKPLLQEALANSEHAISLDNSNKDAWFQRVCTLYFWGKYPEADHYLRQATAKFPDCNDFDPLRPLIEKHLR